MKKNNTKVRPARESLTPGDFIKEIAGPARRPFYLISGDDPKGRQKCLEAVEAVVAPDFRDFNYKLLYLAECGVGPVLAEASTRPFFTPPRVLLVRLGQEKVEDLERIVDYLDDPNPEALVVFLADKVDGRLKFYKRLQAEGVEIACLMPQGPALAAWLAAELAAYGVKAEPGAAALVVERVGEAPAILAGEVEKISLYLGEGGVLTRQLAAQLTSLSPCANIFALGEALGGQDLPGALAQVLDLLSQKHPMFILPMIVRHFRIIMKIKIRQAELEAGSLPGEEAGRLGLHPFVLKKIQGQARSWPFGPAAAALSLLETAHRGLVTSAASPQTILENLVVNLGRLLAEKAGVGGPSGLASPR